MGRTKGKGAKTRGKGGWGEYRVIPSRLIDSNNVDGSSSVYLVAEGAGMVWMPDHGIQKPQLQPVGLKSRCYLHE